MKIVVDSMPDSPSKCLFCETCLQICVISTILCAILALNINAKENVLILLNQKEQINEKK